MPVLAPVNLFWWDNSLNLLIFEPLELSAMVGKLQTPFPAVSSNSQKPLGPFKHERKHSQVHSLLKARGVGIAGPRAKYPDTKTPDVPTTVSSVLSRSRATNTTTSTSFRDSLPSCSQCWGASLTALSMVRTGLRVFSSRFLGRSCYTCSSSAAFTVEGEVCPDQWYSLLNKK